jgi:hypothetical protein
MADVQTVEVRVTRAPGPRLAPEDFARRYLALCTALGVEATLTENARGVAYGEGLEEGGPEDLLTQGLVALLEARFDI